MLIPILTRGKHKGEPVRGLDEAYLRWVIVHQSLFPKADIEVAGQELHRRWTEPGSWQVLNGRRGRKRGQLPRVLTIPEPQTE